MFVAYAQYILFFARESSAIHSYCYIFHLKLDRTVLIGLALPDQSNLRSLFFITEALI